MPGLERHVICPQGDEIAAPEFAARWMSKVSMANWNIAKSRIDPYDFSRCKTIGVFG